MALKFGKKIIYPVQIFFQNSLVFCFVNLKPVVPGHILISPIRNVSKISELTEQESCELWLRVKSVSEIIENHYKKSSQICVQDGKAAGQSIDHVHVHVMPTFEKEYKFDFESKKSRSLEEMENEANIYKAFFDKL